MTGVAIYLVYLLAGIVAGLVSGLFGLGGGLTIVPALAVRCHSKALSRNT